MKNACRLYVHHVIGCLIGSVALLGLSGCGSSPQSAQPQAVSHDDHVHDHDHDHDHAAPEDFSAGVATLRGHYQVIRDAFGENDLECAYYFGIEQLIPARSLIVLPVP
jgi:hypothetical protein